MQRTGGRFKSKSTAFIFAAVATAAASFALTDFLAFFFFFFFWLVGLVNSWLPFSIEDVSPSEWDGEGVKI